MPVNSIARMVHSCFRVQRPFIIVIQFDAATCPRYVCQFYRLQCDFDSDSTCSDVQFFVTTCCCVQCHVWPLTSIQTKSDAAPESQIGSHIGFWYSGVINWLGCCIGSLQVYKWQQSQRPSASHLCSIDHHYHAQHSIQTFFLEHYTA